MSNLVVCWLDASVARSFSRSHHNNYVVDLDDFYNNVNYQSLKTRFKEAKNPFVERKAWESDAVIEVFRAIHQDFLAKRKHNRCLYHLGSDISQIVKEIFSKNRELLGKMMKKTKGRILRLYGGELELEEIGVAEQCCIRKTTFLSLGSDTVRDNRDFVMKCVRLNGLNLKYASMRLQSDYKIALAAVKQNGKAIRYVNSNMFTSELVKTALLQNPRCILYVRNFVKNNFNNDPEISSAVRRFLQNQAVCKPKRWGRGQMFENIFSNRMQLRRQHSIPYEETNKQEIKIWGDKFSSEVQLLKSIPMFERIYNPPQNDDEDEEYIGLFF